MKILKPYRVWRHRSNICPTRWRLQACVYACVVEIKPGMLRASLMYAFRRAYGLTYKMVTFIAKKGLFNTVYWSSKLQENNEMKNTVVAQNHFVLSVTNKRLQAWRLLIFEWEIHLTLLLPFLKMLYTINSSPLLVTN